MLDPNRSLVRLLVLAPVVMLLLGVLSGIVWISLAEPARWEIRDNGIALTEVAAKDQFSVIVVFVVIGALVSMAWAWVTAVVVRGISWLIVPMVVLFTSLAAVIAWRVGVEFGPPDPVTVSGRAVGDTIPDQLKIDSLAPFLIWPLFGLVGVVAGMLTRRPSSKEAQRTL